MRIHALTCTLLRRTPATKRRRPFQTRQVCPLPEEAPLSPAFDDADIVGLGPRPHDAARAAAARFLDHDANARQFSGGAA